MRLPIRVFVALGLASLARAQTPLQWRQLTHLVPPAAAAWDSARQATTLLWNEGGFRHFEWDGAQATERLHALDGANGIVWLGDDPLRRELVALQVDPVRIGRFDGCRWTFVAPPGSPALDARVRCTFDARRGRLVAFEGTGTPTAVHEWDGSAWWSSVALPGLRDDAAFAFDAQGQRCVLYGGISNGAPLADCWSWDGSTWTLLAANAAPGPRSGASLAAAPNGALLLYGGSAATTTWQLAGSAWTPVPTAHDPGPRTGATLVRDPLGLLLLGGSGDPAAWHFLGTDWVATTTTFAGPPRTPFATVAEDRVRAQLVITGGGAPNPMATWLLDTAWRLASPTTSPPPRNGTHLSWSPGNQRVLLFGGIDAANTELADTWTWTGSDWVRHLPASSPPGRHGALIAEDAAGTVMLFGGVGGTTLLGDQWHWNGAQWQQRTPGNQPVVNVFASICHDPLRARTMLLTVSGPNTVTHEWDGATWTLAATTPITTFVPRPIGFDPKRSAVITAGMPAFQWNGTTWTSLGGPTTTASSTVLVTDHVRQRLLRITLTTPLLVAAATDHAADAALFGIGCALGPPPALAAIAQPTPGSAFAIDFGTQAAAAPTFLVLGLGEQFVPLGSGCASLVAVPLATRFALAGPGAHVRHAVPIPNDPGLRGVQFTAQGAVWEPGRSLLGTITLTAGLRITIGD